MRKTTKKGRGEPAVYRPRGRPASATAPLKVVLDPRLKLDLLLAAQELGVPIVFLVDRLLRHLRGEPNDTTGFKVAFAEALADEARRSIEPRNAA